MKVVDLCTDKPTPHGFELMISRVELTSTNESLR